MVQRQRIVVRMSARPDCGDGRAPGAPASSVSLPPPPLRIIEAGAAEQLVGTGRADEEVRKLAAGDGNRLDVDDLGARQGLVAGDRLRLGGRRIVEHQRVEASAAVDRIDARAVHAAFDVDERGIGAGRQNVVALVTPQAIDAVAAVQRVVALAAV